jgi:DNA-binding protein YbaB
MRPENPAGVGIPTGDLDPDRMLADITARADQLRQTAAGVAAQLAEASGTGRSPDGVATVTVAPTGALQDVRLSPRATGMHPAQLSRSIMAAAQAAQAQASQAMMAAFAPLGEGTDTMNMILDYIPKTDEAEPAEEERDLAAVEETEEHATEPARPPVVEPVAPSRRRAARPTAADEDDNAPW